MRRRMTRSTLRFAEENFLPVQFLSAGFLRIKFSIPSQLWSWRKVQQFLKFSHEMNLATAFQYVHPFLSRDDRIAIEIRCPLLELREVLDCFQRSLRAKQPLNVNAAQRRCFDPMAKLLRPNVADEMECPVCSTVRMTIKTGHTAARLFRTAVIGLIELLLRERGEQQSQPLDLFGIENAVKDLIEVIDRD